MGSARLVAVSLLVAVGAHADEPPPYALPFQLRSAAAPSVVRSDTAFAEYSDAAGTSHGATIVSTLLVSYQVLNRGMVQLAPLLRLAVSGNLPPGNTPDGASFVNPAVGAVLSLKLPADLRLAFFLAVTIPVGMGGGDTPDPAQAAATRAGVLARSAMDNALFAVNDFTIFPGIDFAWVKYGFTVQVEATVLELMRVRGAMAQKDEFKTNFTTGGHVGYFIIPQLSVGVELRYQRWLSTPVAVAADPSMRGNLTIAGGVRGHFRLGDRFWLRPAISYTRGLDGPVGDLGYNIVQLDVPFFF